MRLTFELSPAQESELQTAARREGMPITDYAHQLFATALRQKIPVQLPLDEPLDWEAELKWAQEQAQEAFLASGKTDEEVITDTEAAVDAHRSEMASQEGRKPNP